MVDNSDRVIPRGKSGFDVEMAMSDGRRKSVTGFASEHEANAWIVQAKRMIRDAGPWTPLAPRKPTATPNAQSPPAPSQVQQQVHNARNRAAPRRTHAGTARELAAVKS